jgi:hypothetical protein
MEAPCGRKSELERQVQGQKQISPLRGVATRASSGRNDTEIQKQNQGQEQGRVQGQKQISPLRCLATRGSSGRNDAEIQKTNQGQVQGRVQGQKQISPLHIRASANVPVGMTPKFKSKTKRS